METTNNDIIPNDRLMDDNPVAKENTNLTAEVLVGSKIRELRNLRGLSLRRLAARSGLNINTLSLVENAKTSPSIGTLQQLANALEVPLAEFFESEPISLRIVFTSHKQRPDTTLSNGLMENLGKDLADNAVQPFVVSLKSGGGSGERNIVHTGHEFVYCLRGRVLYTVEDKPYLLEPGDSLVFESHLPHRWQNAFDGESQIILVLIPTDQRDLPCSRHFSDEQRSVDTS